MRYCLFICLLFITIAARCQTLEGIVTDGITGKPLFAASVMDVNTKLSTYTDQNGRYSLPAKSGDPIQFSYVGYKQVTNITPASLVLASMNVGMQPQNYELDEYTIHANYTPFQIDSMKRRREYAKELDKQPVKIKGSTTGNGVGVDGLIGALVQKGSKSEKKRKQFVKEFQQAEQDRFIDTRYTRELVSILTGFTGDTLAVFMNAYPMDYSFARTAPDLELKMWIRYNYREYIKKDSTLAPAKKE